jgi:hypothetical protein
MVVSLCGTKATSCRACLGRAYNTDGEEHTECTEMGEKLVSPHLLLLQHLLQSQRVALMLMLIWEVMVV